MDIKSVFNDIAMLKMVKFAGFNPSVEGISFRYKTVQFHLLDDTFEEFKKNTAFGKVKVYSERFSLPGFGKKSDLLDPDDYQFEVDAYIESKVNRDVYKKALQEVTETIEKKHGVKILVEEYELEEESFPNKPQLEGEFYNINRITFYTNDKSIFPEE
jgi:hypothetical protein